MRTRYLSQLQVTSWKLKGGGRNLHGTLRHPSQATLFIQVLDAACANSQESSIEHDLTSRGGMQGKREQRTELGEGERRVWGRLAMEEWETAGGDEL